MTVARVGLRNTEGIDQLTEIVQSRHENGEVRALEGGKQVEAADV